MKKTLLLLSTAALSAVAASAFEPTVLPGKAIAGISPDGNLAVSYVNGEVFILDLQTGKEYHYPDTEGVATGNGNAMSNTGVVVGETNYSTTASWWKDGEWHMITNPETVAMSYANGITRDGKRIVGTVSPDTYDGSLEGLMLVPCYWDLEADGTYGKTNHLPYPEKDLTGRTPQYITAISVSTDGKVIAGQIMDYSGAVTQPIVYTQVEDGKWTYTLPHNELYHPEGFELPEDPGDSPDALPESFMTEEERAAYEKAVEEYWENQNSLVSPEPTDFMSPDKLAAYQAALDEYFETWDDEKYPDAKDYMSDEEWAGYQEALDEYDEKANSLQYPDAEDYLSEEGKAAYAKAREESEKWDEKWNEFSEKLNELIEMVPNFTFNNVLLSPDGKTYATSYSRESFNPMTWEFISESKPYVLNLTDGTYKSYETDGVNLIVSSMTDDGTLLAHKPADYMGGDFATVAYVLPAGESTFLPLHQYMASVNPGLGAWMTENMTHEFTAIEMNPETGEPFEVTKKDVGTGVPFASADFGVIGLGVENFWDEFTDEEYYVAYAYLFRSDWASINAVAKGSVSVRAMPGASLAFTGNVASAAVYDLSGRVTFSVTAPDAVVSTGLASGVYVVKAVATDGSVTVVKVAL